MADGTGDDEGGGNEGGDDDEADELAHADGEECAQMVHGHHKAKKMRR